MPNDTYASAAAAIFVGDYATALKILRALAEQGDAVAAKKLGDMYEIGEGVPKDKAEAARWFRLAAEQGHAEAPYILGITTKDDDAEAAEWFRMAADQGHPKAQHILGVWYELGKGVPQDHVLAHMWLNLAQMYDKDDAVARAVKDRNRMARLMTRDQIAEAQRRAREWLEKRRATYA